MGGSEALEFSDPNDIETSSAGLTSRRNGHLSVSKCAAVAYVLLSVALAVVVGVVVHFASPGAKCNCPQECPSPPQCPTTPEPPSDAEFWQRCVNMSWERNECLPGVLPCTTTQAPTDTPTSVTPLPPADDKPEDYLLPTDLIPHHYDIELRPDIYKEDSADFIFNGTSTMHFFCQKATDVIVLHYRLLTIDNESIAVNEEGSDAAILISSTNMRPTPFDFYTITLEERMEAGKNYSVTTKFTGPLNRDMTGMYWSSYYEHDVYKYMVATQFEAPDARKAFPCMDEPQLKATFNVSMWHKEGFTALGNMPNYTEEEGPDNWILTRFERTSVVMPTYLVAFAVANYSYVESFTDGGLGTHKPSRYWARHDYIEKGYSDFVSINFTDTVFDYFEEYFNHPYLLPKQDQIAIPDFAAGAMENWGLITYREERLLWDPVMSTEYEKQRASGTIAHEFLHMWLGNVVTCKWWSGIWLQEGMARHHQHLAVQVAQPTWDLDGIFIAQVLWRAFSRDQMGDAHPIHNPTIGIYRNPDSVFTAITYDKAGSFIRMMCDVVMGRESYGDAMREYVDKMQYGSAVYNDLFQSWDVQAAKDNLGINMTNVGLSWIMQTGHPVVKLTRHPGTNAVRAEHQIFLIEPSRPLDEWYESPYGYAWNIPLTYITKSDRNKTVEWLDRENRSINLGRDLDEDEWILANGDQRGLYRVNYDMASWNLLINQLNTDHTEFDVTSRAALVHDSLDLSRAGHTSPVIALRVAQFLENDASYLPWYGFELGLDYFHKMMFRSPHYSLLRSYIVSLTDALYDQFTWEEEDPTQLFREYLRTLVLSQACENGHEECVQDALNKFTQWRNDPDDLIHSNVREAVYCTAIEMGTEGSWDFLFAQYLQSWSHFSLERQRRRDGLACSSETWILKRYLNMSVARDPLIHDSDRSSIMQSVIYNPAGHSVAWDYLITYWDDIAASYRRTMLTAFSQTFNTEMDKAKLEDLIVAHPPDLPPEREFYDSLLITVNTNIAWTAANMDDIVQWLRETTSA